MLLFRNNHLYSNLLENGSEGELYQHRFNLHQQNARARVKDTGLIYDAIKLAQAEPFELWQWQASQAENHPALVKLCDFWECFQDEVCPHEARIPYIQLFLGNEVYTPLVHDGAAIPLKMPDEDLRQQIKSSSVLFGDEFLVTYLAGRHVTAKQSGLNHLVYCNVYDQVIMKDDLFLSGKRSATFNHENQLACKTLKALTEFPDRFPELWQSLIEQHEVQNDEIH